MTLIPTDLAHYKYLTEWIPKVGDIIIWHGWLTHWYGVVRSINATNNTVSVIKSGLPLLLLTLDQSEYDDNAVEIPISKIRKGSGGKYAAIKSVGGNTVWFI